MRAAKSRLSFRGSILTLSKISAPPLSMKKSSVRSLSRAEIAEQMERSEGAVRVLLHRALARLSELLSTESE